MPSELSPGSDAFWHSGFSFRPCGHPAIPTCHGRPYWPFIERCAREDRPLVTGLTIKKPDDLYINRDMFEHKYVCRRRDIGLHRERNDAKLLEGAPKKSNGGGQMPAQDAHLQIERPHLRNARLTRRREQPKNPQVAIGPAESIGPQRRIRLQRRYAPAGLDRYRESGGWAQGAGALRRAGSRRGSPVNDYAAD